MKLGFSDVLLIVIIMGVVLVIFRGLPPREAPPAPVKVRRLTADQIEDERILYNRQKHLRMLGGAFVGVGLIVLAGAFKLFDILISWYTFAGLIILVGIVVIFLSARR
jgi:hypothetical protein